MISPVPGPASGEHGTAGGAHFAFTDRWGGVSAAPYAQLNLGGAVGDDPAAVRANRVSAAGTLGLDAADVVWMNQVHGRDVAVVEGAWGERPVPEVDAVVTARRGLALAVLTADCVPVLLADPVAGICAAAHAGRPGMAAGVVPAAVEAMVRLGADPARITARTGPAVCGRCYEVPEALRAEVAAVEPAAYAETSWGTPHGRRGRRCPRPAGAARGDGPAGVGDLHPGVGGPLLVPARGDHGTARLLCVAGPMSVAGLEEMTDRKTELAANLERVEQRIVGACAAAGRDRDEVTLIVVTKTYPASDVRLLAELGVGQVAENRDQDAAPKAAACADLDLTWHFVGQLQTNKARSVAGYADFVQSVDRAKLVTSLSSAAERAGRELGCLVQVALDAEAAWPGRPGRRGAGRCRGVGRADRGGARAPARGSDDGRTSVRHVRRAARGGLRTTEGNLNLPARGLACCHHGFRGDERGPRTRRGRRGDTCTRRQCGTRSPTRARVTSRSKSDHSRKYGHSRSSAG